PRSPSGAWWTWSRWRSWPPPSPCSPSASPAERSSRRLDEVFSLTQRAIGDRVLTVTKLTDTDAMRHSGSAAGAQVPVIAEVFGGLVLILGLVLGLLISSGCEAPR